jgi:hypothetical protein
VERLGLAGHEGQLGGDAGTAGGELNAELCARGSFSKELLALLHCIVARADAELEPRLLAVLRVGGRHVSLHAAKHVDPVVALALGHSVHEEPDEADEGRTLGADGGAQRCVARAVQRTAHTQLCSVNRKHCDVRGRQLLGTAPGSFSSSTLHCDSSGPCLCATP